MIICHNSKNIIEKGDAGWVVRKGKGSVCNARVRHDATTLITGQDFVCVFHVHLRTGMCVRPPYSVHIPYTLTNVFSTELVLLLKPTPHTFTDREREREIGRAGGLTYDTRIHGSNRHPAIYIYLFRLLQTHEQKQ